VTPSVIIGMAVVILYSTFGGLWAVIQTDMMQFVLLGVLIPVTLLVGVYRSGGVDALMAAIPDTHLGGLGGMTFLAFAGLFVSFLLGETLVPPYAQRTFSTPDGRHARIGFVLTGVFSALFFFISASLGLVALHLFPGIDPEAALPTVVMELLPVGLVGLVVAALLAVVMSTASSYMNSAAIVLIKDIHQAFLKPDTSNAQRLWLERATTVVVGVLATLFAISVPSIVDALLYAYSLWAPTVILPLLGAVLLGCRSTVAAVSAIVAGGATTAVWTWVLGDPFGVPGVIAGVGANALVFTVLSLLDRTERWVPAAPRTAPEEA
jgi:SSS family solute:Na+ symporter